MLILIAYCGWILLKYYHNICVYRGLAQRSSQTRALSQTAPRAEDSRKWWKIMSGGSFIPEYFSRLQHFLPSSFMSQKNCCILVDADNVNYALSNMHLNSCYYHKTVWKLIQRWGKKVLQLLAKFWLLLTVSPPPTSGRGLWNQALLAWKGLCLSQSSLLPSKSVHYLLKVVPWLYHLLSHHWELFERDRTGWAMLSQTRTLIRGKKNQFPKPGDVL